MKPFLDIDKIREISLLFEGKEYLIDELISLLVKSGFSQSSVLLYYNLNKTPENIIFSIIKNNAFSENILQNLNNLADNLLLLDTELSSKLALIINNIKFRKNENIVPSNKTINLNDIILNNLEIEIKRCVINGLKTNDFLVYLRELVNIINNKLKIYSMNKGISFDKGENDLVNIVFDKEDFFIKGLDMTTISGKNWKKGLHNILNGIFNLRNSFSHDSVDSNFLKNLNIDSIKFIEIALLVDFLLKELDKLN